MAESVPQGSVAAGKREAPAPDTDPDCPVCCRAYTGTTRKRVGCSSCDAVICTACLKTYLLGAVERPHCYACRAAWSPMYVAEHLSPSFVKTTLNGHIATIDVARERSLLPAVMGRVADLKRAQKIRAEADELSRKASELNSEAYRIENSRGIPSKKTKREFVMPCQKESCPGFLSRAYVCGLCDGRVCRDCLEPVPEPVPGLVSSEDSGAAAHTCEPGALETAAMIRKTTRPCPECGTRISRVAGCDQMWCTACNTAFNYRTGAKIDSGRVHNPHYFEWLFRGGDTAAQGAVVGECGALDNHAVTRNLQKVIADPGSHEVRPEYRDVYDMVIGALDFVRDCARIIAGGRHVTPDISITSEVDFEAARINYLMGRRTESQWAQWVRQQRRCNTYRAEVRAILETYRTVVVDLLRRIGNDDTAADAVNTFVGEEARMRAFANDALGRTDTLVGYRRGYVFLCGVPRYNRRRKFTFKTCTRGAQVSTVAAEAVRTKKNLKKLNKEAADRAKRRADRIKRRQIEAGRKAREVFEAGRKAREDSKASASVER